MAKVKLARRPDEGLRSKNLDSFGDSMLRKIWEQWRWM